ncbi:MAG: hypothetical protein RJB01_1729 [Actinomycetota bacterium]
MGKRPTHFLGTPVTANGPLGPDMLRDFRVIRRNPLEYLNEVWQEYGDVVQFPIPRPPSYLVNSPEAVRHVLVANARNYGKRTIQYRALSLVTGEGLLTADTPSWRRQRPLVQPAFHHEASGALLDHVCSAAQRVILQWDGLCTGEVVDADAAMMHAALEVVGEALFGADLSGDAAVITSATLRALDVVIARARVPITPPGWVPTPANRVLRSSLRDLDSAVEILLANQNESDTTNMVALLRSARDDNGDRLSAREIRDQIVTFIVAGHETVASALSWAILLLAFNPDVQQRIAQEVEDACGERQFTHAELARMSYTRAVVDETLRLYPPAWLITRQALGPDVLPSGAKAAVEVPRGSLIIMSPWLMHRHGERWSEPERFHPERMRVKYPRDAFIPFGAGPRLCIGRDFSYIESVALLAALVRRYHFTPVHRQLPEAEPLVTIRPRGGAPVRITRRV